MRLSICGGMRMRSIAAAVVLMALPFGAQAQMASPQTAPGTRLSGIAGPAGDTTDRSRELRRIVERQRHASRINDTSGAYDAAVSRELHEAYEDIDRRRENGELTKREARQLRREASRIAELSDIYALDGLSHAERSELRMHASVLASRANAPRR